MELKDMLQHKLHRIGGPGNLPSVPDGPVVPICRPLELAQALESELNRAASMGHSKITIHMDLGDAAEFATMLRRAALLGA